MPDNADAINQKEIACLGELDKFKEENKAGLEAIPRQSHILVTPQDAFDYFTKAYNMNVVAPQDVTTDAEVANNDMQKTVDVIVENKVKGIFVESTTNQERIRNLRFSTIHSYELG